MINIVGSSRYKLNKKSIKAFVKTLFEPAGIQPQSTLNIALVGKRKMKEIAKTYKNENVALPVLAFPYHEKNNTEQLLGEIVICYPQAVLLAAERNKRVDDMFQILIEHGLKNILTH